MKVYLDVCCLNRPFDDQSQYKIRLESEAVICILGMIETGDIEWVCSEAVDLETDKNSDEEKKDRVRQICRKASEYIKLTDGIENRAITLEASGFGAFDAMHLATAESAHAEVLFTTDQKFERLAARRRKNLGVSVVNPLQWVKERCR